MPQTQQPYDHDDLSLRGRIDAHRQHDARGITRAVHEGAWAGFLKQVDPHSELDDAERWRQATHARNAHLLELSRRSARTSQRAGRSPPTKHSRRARA
jgi:hypothetical protein